MLTKAEAYILKAKEHVNPQFRQHFHLMPPTGWMNDPNGAIFINDEYHLFYQFYPYDSVWGPMHWGHAKSQDGIVWQDLPVALAPDEVYDQHGCFSGTSLAVDGSTYLLYTGAIQGEAGEPLKQVQCLAQSADMLTFSKVPTNPVIGGHNLHKSINPFEFRDPKLFKREGIYYALIVSQTQKKTGQLILYQSLDLIRWQFKSILLEGTSEFGRMWECPDYFESDGKDVLIISPIEMPAQGEKYTNYASSLYLVGEIDWQIGKFQLEYYDEIDQGLDFYAPQTMLTPGGIVMTAWMHMWERTNVTSELGHGWSGCLTLPRKLRLVNGHLIQQPLETIYDDYRPLEISLDQVAHSQSFHLDSQGITRISSPSHQSFNLSLSNEKNETVRVTYDATHGAITLSRAEMAQKINGQERHQVESRTYLLKGPSVDQIKLELFLDASSLEVFINEGEGVMSCRLYPQLPWTILTIASEN